MLRKATETDFLDLIQFRCEACGCTRTTAANWLQGVIGFENILLLQKPGAEGRAQIAAMLAAVPVRTGYRHGVWFSGLATRPDLQGRGLMTKLLETCLRAYTQNGCDFAVTTPENPREAAWLGRLSFQSAFPLRVINKPIPRYLMAQAEFDTMTVRRLLETRLRYQPGCVLLPETCMTGIITQLYSRGMTLVSNPRGYGLYYHSKDTLQVIELQADNDHSADVLLQAAREKTGADKARLLLAENQALYLGEGKRNSYGMIRYLKQPFPLTDVYFRLLL